MVSKKCFEKGLKAVNVLYQVRQITGDVVGGYHILMLDRLERNPDLEKYRKEIEALAKTTEYEFDTLGWAKGAYEKAKALERKVIADAFDTVIDCEKIPEYEEEWRQWWDGMDLSERGELSKKISVRSVDFFELTEGEKEAIRSHAAEEGIL